MILITNTSKISKKDIETLSEYRTAILNREKPNTSLAKRFRSLMFMNTDLTEKNIGTLSSSMTTSQINHLRQELAIQQVENLILSGLSASTLLEMLTKPQQCTKLSILKRI